MADRPNILFIVSDQHNAKVLQHTGSFGVHTPHLSRMAAEGVSFNNATTQSPICTPSRVSFLSGQYCHNHGYYGLSGRNPGGLPTIFGHFRGAGYRTGAIGKIHCPEYWVEDDCDVFHETCEVSIGGRSPAYTRFLKERGKEHLEDNTILPEFGERGRQSMEGRPSPLTFEESQEGWLAARAVETMQQAAAANQPFLLHVSFPRPHQCTSPSQAFWDLYDQASLTLPPNADYDMVGKAPHLRQMAATWRTRDWPLIEPKTFEAARLRKLHGYLAAVSQVDAAVGVMLDYLRESGLADNTIVVYTSDHGDYACEHGIMEKAPGICSDAITRVPMIWWSPKRLAQGHIANEIVELIDLSTTFCALAGLPLLETSDGKDITHLLMGEQGAVRELGVTEFAWSKSLRKGPYRFVYYPREMFADDYPDGFGELYDLEADPWEMTNLFFEADYQGLVQAMRHDLLDWLVTTTRPGTVLGVNSRFPFQPAGDQTAYRFLTNFNRDGKIHPDRLRNATGKNYL
ncbi:MAG: hypothetical protein CL610_07005 [Anaerolineaceae bacterium]|nr:hypothetical protein [Anaerolineaceae bacterium]